MSFHTFLSLSRHAGLSFLVSSLAIGVSVNVSTIVKPGDTSSLRSSPSITIQSHELASTHQKSNTRQGNSHRWYNTQLVTIKIGKATIALVTFLATGL